jgi:glycine oxidase
VNQPPQRLAEHSLDPRQLASALLAAVRSANIEIREHCEFHLASAPPNATVVYTTGAWVPEELRRTLLVRPRKGQMLRVQLPPTLHTLREVHRSSEVYVVPRTLGPHAGTALIGATVEDAGFDTSTHSRDLTHLRELATELLPALASEKDAPQLEAWAGLRPHTPDRLPVLGPAESGSHHFLATGHYRNGILLAPATAVVLADLIEGKSPALDLAPFALSRFAPS